MPVYAYLCQNCGLKFERTQTFFEPPLKRCLDCHQNTLQRIIQVSAILFKGSGWYSMDQRSRNSQIPGTSKTKGAESGIEILQKGSSSTKQVAINKNKNGVLK